MGNVMLFRQSCKKWKEQKLRNKDLVVDVVKLIERRERS